MKIMKSLLMTLVIATALASCSKNNNDTTPPFSIEGTWEGKIGTGTAIPSGQYALKIKPGGGIERINSSGTATASGGWQLTGNNFTATYNYSNGTVVNLVGTIDKGKNKLTASWENNGGEEGSLYANKQ